MTHDFGRIFAESSDTSGSALLGIAAVISAIGVAIGGVIGSVTAMVKAFRTPTAPSRPRKHDHDDEDGDADE